MEKNYKKQLEVFRPSALNNHKNSNFRPELPLRQNEINYSR